MCREVKTYMNRPGRGSVKGRNPERKGYSMNDHPTNSNDNSRLEALLKITAQRMGSTPEALKEAAQNGNLSQVLGNVSQDEGEAMQKVLSDPEAAKKLLSSPQAQALLKMFQGGK